jgi:hypothetical protein
MVSRFAGMMIFANIAFDQFLNLGRIDIAFLAMTNLKNNKIKNINICLFIKGKLFANLKLQNNFVNAQLFSEFFAFGLVHCFSNSLLK